MMIPYPWHIEAERLTRDHFSGHSALSWLIAALLFIAVFAGLKAAVHVSRKALRMASRHRIGLPALLERTVSKTSSWLLATLAFVAASERLNLTSPTRTRLIDIGATALFIQLALWGHAFIRAGTDHYRTKTGDGERVTVVVALGLIATILLWVIITLAALNNLGVNVTALLAGFGVGGVAVALALQTTLADFLASLSILFDKPFVLGDYIAIDTFAGTVEHIGLKTTHLHSATGEQIIIANSDLVKSRVRNYKRMRERTLMFTLYLTYENRHEALANATRVAEDVIKSDGRVRFLRAYLKDYQPQGLVFEVAYVVNEDHADVYMDVQHAINLALFRAFHDRGIEFVRPGTVNIQYVPPATAKEPQ
ncbi:MAG: mechanosensitive ion channel family protein [Acidiferrobacter sp.]